MGMTMTMIGCADSVRLYVPDPVKRFLAIELCARRLRNPSDVNSPTCALSVNLLFPVIASMACLLNIASRPVDWQLSS